MVKSFIDLANMVKGLMDENQQPSVQQELEKCSPVQVVEGGETKAESFIGLVQVNHLLLQQLIQILVLQRHLPQNERLEKYGDQKLVETSKFFLFFHVKSSDFRFVTWFMSILKFGFPRLSFEVFRTKQKVSCFEQFQSHSNEI